jgi:hypothetical protein
MKVVEYIYRFVWVSSDSTMVEYFDQQQWENLVEDFKDVYTARSDGVTVKANL